jgi:uncharacterized MAPEG superfamily protein
VTAELAYLAWSVVLGMGHIVLAAAFTRRQYGMRWAASARDDPAPPMSPMTGRADRALRNYLESFAFFVAAVLAAHLAGRHDWMTVWGAALYFWARVVYIPLYLFGVFLVRSLVWNVAVLGILLMLASLLRPA